MLEQDEGNDERESSSEEEETFTSWTVTEQQKSVSMLQDFDEVEIDVSLQRKEATTDTQSAGS